MKGSPYLQQVRGVSGLSSAAAKAAGKMMMRNGSTPIVNITAASQPSDSVDAFIPRLVQRGAAEGDRDSRASAGGQATLRNYGF